MQLVQLEYRLDSTILSHRTLHIRIGDIDVRTAIDKVAKQTRSKALVPGFRLGKAPLHVVRNHHSARIGASAFDELKQAAFEHLFKQLDKKDQPFLPVEVVDRDKIRLVYGEPLEFAVQYLVDPSGMSQKPESPQQHFNPLAHLHSRTNGGMTQGLTNSPAPPSIPLVPGAPSVPQLPLKQRNKTRLGR